MKRSGWAPASARMGSAPRKRSRTKAIVDDILRDSYRLYARDRASRKAVKHCLG